MAAHDYLSADQFDPESRPAHENYGISFENGDETRGVPATSRLGERNAAIRKSVELGSSNYRSHQVYGAKSTRADVARIKGQGADYINELRPVTPYGNGNPN